LNPEKPDATAAVVINQLTKRYGTFTALDRLTLSLERGRILGFIGPNGAGKTTTIKILVGLARPTSGSAAIAGADCTRESRKIKRLVGYMPDTFGSYDNMRVREYLDFFGAAFSIPRRQRLLRIDEVMNITGTAYMKDRYVESLSHGMKQRVGVARTLLHDPQVLILDEPAGGLDPQARIEMRALLLQLASLGKTLIVTSHILPDLSRICDRVAIITHGVLRAFGTLEDILRMVSPLRMMEVQLSRTEQLDRAREMVKQHLEENAEVTVSPAEAIVRFRTARSDDDVGALLSQLVSAGVRVNQFREVQTDLEDTFLSITRNVAGGDGAKAAPEPAPLPR
jgi:ABC-2 type transport system ATP-binding protein